MWIGIDQKGGVAMVADGGELIAYMRTPIIQLAKRPTVDTAELSSWMTASRPVGLESVLRGIVIEKVHSMPKQGVSSSFSFGRHLGAVEGWAIGQGCKIVMPAPSVWKVRLGLGSSKTASLDRARQDFGDLSIWKVKANDGIAEAALLALHCRSY